MCLSYSVSLLLDSIVYYFELIGFSVLLSIIMVNENKEKKFKTDHLGKSRLKTIMTPSLTHNEIKIGSKIFLNQFSMKKDIKTGL